MEKRLTGYIDEQEHRKLKARLAAQGMKINDWLRRVVKLELEGKLTGGEQVSKAIFREGREQDDAGKDDLGNIRAKVQPGQFRVHDD